MFLFDNSEQYDFAHLVFAKPLLLLNNNYMQKNKIFWSKYMFNWDVDLMLEIVTIIANHKFSDDVQSSQDPSISLNDMPQAIIDVYIDDARYVVSRAMQCYWNMFCAQHC